MRATWRRPAAWRSRRICQGAEHFTIAAADTLMREPSAALMEKAFPGVPVKPGIGEFDTLLSIDKAKRVLGYQPKHTWRGQL